MACRMASPELDKRTGIYYIRVGIPKLLWPYFKRYYGKAWEWKKQLLDQSTGQKARTAQEAKRLWPSYYEEWQAVKSAAEGSLSGKSSGLSDRQIAALCADWLKNQLSSFKDQLPEQVERDVMRYEYASLLEVDGCEEDLLEVDGYEGDLSSAKVLKYLDRKPFIAEEAASLLDQHHIPLSRGSEEFVGFCIRLAWTGVELANVLEARAGGDWQTPEALENTPKLDQSFQPGGETFGSLYNCYKTEKGLNVRQQMAYDKVISDFTSQHGNLLIVRITAAHVRAFKDDLVDRQLAPMTINGRLSNLRGLLQYAVENALIIENPAERIRAAGGRKAKRPRKPWTASELQTLLNGPVHSLGARPAGGQGEAAYWLPLLAIFTGARLEDLAQLLPEDVRVEANGIPIVDINDNHGKQVKNDSTARKVPLHRELVNLGFLKYVDWIKEQGEEKVFPGVKTYRGQVAKAWGQWFGKYKRQLLPDLPTDVLKDFHSFRHAFKDAARDSSRPGYVSDDGRLR